MQKLKKFESFEQACEALNIPATLPDFSFAPEEDREALISHYKLVIIAKATNGNWTPDWDNGDQWKYYPWFDMEGGFSLSFVDAFYQVSLVGSRPSFFSRDAAEYVAAELQ